MSNAARRAGLAQGESVGRCSVGRQAIVCLIVGVAFAFSDPMLVGGMGQTINAQAAEQQEAGFATLTSAELASMLQHKDFVFVNVHIPYEGEIEGTDAFIAFDKIAANLDKLPADKTAKIVLYCRSGRMSEIAAEELSRLGYTQVSHLSGGMIDWKKSGDQIMEQ